MVASADLHPLVRLDDLEGKAWGYFARGKARGNSHTTSRAERLLKSCHERGIAFVTQRVTGYPRIADGLKWRDRELYAV